MDFRVGKDAFETIVIVVEKIIATAMKAFTVFLVISFIFWAPLIIAFAVVGRQKTIEGLYFISGSFFIGFLVTTIVVFYARSSLEPYADILTVFKDIILSDDPSGEVRAKALRELSKKLEDLILGAIRPVLFFPPISFLCLGILLIIGGKTLHPKQTSALIGGAIMVPISTIALLIATFLYFVIIRPTVKKLLKFTDNYESRHQSDPKTESGESASTSVAGKAKSKVKNLRAVGSILT